MVATSLFRFLLSSCLSLAERMFGFRKTLSLRVRPWLLGLKIWRHEFALVSYLKIGELIRTNLEEVLVDLVV
jgi:hypothetical protein